MDYLLDFAGREDVQGLATRYLEHHEAVQGISVDLDDLWLRSWQLLATLNPDDALFPDPRRPWWVSPAAWNQELVHGQGFVSYPFGVDTSWRPRWWSDYISLRDLRDEPYVLKVILRPQFSYDTLSSLREIYTDGLQVRFEPRPAASLYASSTDAVRPLVGGLSVSTKEGPPGTLGGILTDANGAHYGVTCSHVISVGYDALQPSPRDNSTAATEIGECVACSQLSPHDGLLNPYGPSINEDDVALIKLREPSELSLLDVGPLSDIASRSRVNPGASVDVVGKSGRRSVYIGGVVLTHEFTFRGARFGYKNLFELRRRSRFWGLTGTISPPVKPGDSGGWVLIAGNAGTEWLGMIVAGDGPVGYALPAQSVSEWLTANSAEILTVN